MDLLNNQIISTSNAQNRNPEEPNQEEGEPEHSLLAMLSNSTNKET